MPEAGFLLKDASGLPMILFYLFMVLTTILYLATHPWYWHLPKGQILFLGIVWPITMIRILREDDL